MMCRVGLNNPQAYIVAYKGRGEVSSLQGSDNYPNLSAGASSSRRVDNNGVSVIIIIYFNR